MRDRVVRKLKAHNREPFASGLGLSVIALDPRTWAALLPGATIKGQDCDVGFGLDGYGEYKRDLAILWGR